MKAVAYARTSQQESDISIEDQLTRIREYARRLGFDIIEEVIDNEVSTTLDRPGIRHMVAHLNKYDAIIVDKVSRAAETRQLVIEWKEQYLVPHHVELHFVELGRAVEKGDEFLLDMYASQDAAAERIARGREAKARSGVWLGQGTAPYGYRKTGVRKKSDLEISSEEAEIVRRIFELHNGGTNVAAIARQLNADTIPSPSARKQPWRSAKWSPESVRRILRDKRYTGIFSVFRRSKNTKGAAIIMNRPDLAIIDEDIFANSQARIESNADKNRFTTVHSYLMAGRLTCDCGYAVSTQTQTRTRSGVQHSYSYYRCSTKTHNRNVGVRCKVPLLTVEKLDTLIWDHVETTLRNQTETLFQLRQYREELARQQVAEEQERKRTQAKIEKLTAEIERDYFDFRKNLMPESAYVRRKQELEAEIEEIKAQEARISPSLQTVPTDADLQDELRTVGDLLDELSPLSFDEKLRVIDAIQLHGRFELLDDVVRVHLTMYGADIGSVDYSR